jgi:hypothetical protein
LVFREVQEISEMEQAEKGFGSTGIHMMEPDLVKIYAVDLMLTATQGTLKGMIPKCYHEFLSLANPEGPLTGLPPLCPGYDFEIHLDPMKPLPRPAQPYHMGPEAREDWNTWWDTMLKVGHISKAPANTPTAAPFFFIWKKDGSR